MNPTPPAPEGFRKLSQDERDRLLFQLLETSRSDMAHSVSSRVEMLAMRAAILKLAERSGLDRQKFDEWMEAAKKQFHHHLLTRIEDKDAWIASVLDERKEDEI